jgi:hypothetical protein
LTSEAGKKAWAHQGRRGMVLGMIKNLINIADCEDEPSSIRVEADFIRQRLESLAAMMRVK